MGASQHVEGPDFSQGVDLTTIADGATLSGHVGGEPALLSRRSGQYFAVSGACTHYGGMLAEGLIDGDTVHCPLHHACFHLRTGEALGAPAFSALKRWRVDIDGARIVVRDPLEAAPPTRLPIPKGLNRIVIVGGGAAGFAAAEMLRRRGYGGALTMLSDAPDPPVDRPNLSKDYLAGTAPEEWLPLRETAFYRDNAIDLRLADAVTEIDPRSQGVRTASGAQFSYDRLLLAAGASPIRPKGFEHERALVLRTVADSRAIIAAAAEAPRVVIVGAGFIGLEVAASLRARGLEVEVVALETAPMLPLLGPAIAQFLADLHRRNGVRFHLGERALGFDGRQLRLESGRALEADLLILGLGVRPNTELAAKAGLKVSNGVEVDAYLRTSDPLIFAAGDIARYPDPVSGGSIRVEHWAAAVRQGQAAAINMLDAQSPFTTTPFFWSNHYDLSLHYVGHAQGWTDVAIDGDVSAGDFTARYRRDGRLLASVSAGRERESLQIEKTMDEARRAAAAPLF